MVSALWQIPSRLAQCISRIIVDAGPPAPGGAKGWGLIGSASLAAAAAISRGFSPGDLAPARLELLIRTVFEASAIVIDLDRVGAGAELLDARLIRLV